MLPATLTFTMLHVLRSLVNYPSKLTTTTSIILAEYAITFYLLTDNDRSHVELTDSGRLHLYGSLVKLVAARPGDPRR